MLGAFRRAERVAGSRDKRLARTCRSGSASASERTPPARPTVDVYFWPTLLRKSVTADGCPSAIRLLTTGLDLPALTLVTQLQRYAIHGA